MNQIMPECKTKILAAAIPLFADTGYSGISMRRIAKEVGLNAATLYHHFKDKQTLYMKTMSYVFAHKTEALVKILSSDAPPEQRLKQFIIAFCQLINDNPDFGKLIQREILAGDEMRLQMLAEQVFRDLFLSLLHICGELASDYDPHLLAISILGLVIYHYEVTPLRQHQLGSESRHTDPEVVAVHVTRLLLQGVKRE